MKEETFKSTRIPVPTDSSPSSETAIDGAAALAIESEAALYLLNQRARFCKTAKVRRVRVGGNDLNPIAESDPTKRRTCAFDTTHPRDLPADEYRFRPAS